MINGAHVVVYSADADADRDFFRDVLGFAHVDAGGGLPGGGRVGLYQPLHPTGRDL